MKILKLASLFLISYFLITSTAAQTFEYKKGNVLNGLETIASVKTLSLAKGKSQYEVKDAGGKVLVNLNEISTLEKRDLYSLTFPSVGNEALVQTIPPTSMNFEKAIFQFLYNDAKLLGVKGVDEGLVNTLIAKAKPKSIPVPVIVEAVAKVKYVNPNYIKNELVLPYNPEGTEKYWRYYMENRKKTTYTLTASPKGTDVVGGMKLTYNPQNIDWGEVYKTRTLNLQLDITNVSDKIIDFIYARPFHHLIYAKLEVYKDGALVVSETRDDNTAAIGLTAEKFDKSNLRVLKPGASDFVSRISIPNLEEGKYTIKAWYKVDKGRANPLYVSAKYVEQIKDVELFSQDINFTIQNSKGIINNNLPIAPNFSSADLFDINIGLPDALNNSNIATAVKIDGFDVAQAEQLKNLVNLRYLYIASVKEMGAFNVIKDLNLKGLYVSFQQGSSLSGKNVIPANFLKANCLESLGLRNINCEEIPLFLANQKSLKQLEIRETEMNLKQFPMAFPNLEFLMVVAPQKSNWYTLEMFSALKNIKNLQELGMYLVELENLNFLDEIPNLKKVSYVDKKYSKLNEIKYPILKKLSEGKNVKVYFYDVK